MLQRLRHRAQSQEGFTLIELLVVVLIIGILAAVAIPVFLNQTGKANDANVKSDINSAATAEETYYTDNQAYVSASSGSATPITNINPALSGAFNAYNSTSTAPGDSMTITGTLASGSTAVTGYTIVAKDPNGITFTYTKDPSTSAITRTCSVPAGVNQGGCKNPSSTTAGW